MKKITTLMGTAMLCAFLPGQVVAEAHMGGQNMTSAQKMAAQKAKKRQMMMQMMKKMKAAEAARIPATRAIYDPAGGEMGRNLQRFNQPYCLNWRGGPKGTLLPADMKAPDVPPMPGMHGIIGAGYNSACGGSHALLAFSNKGKGAFVRGMLYLENNGGYSTPLAGPDIANDNDRLAYSIGAGVFRPDGSFLSFDIRSMRRNEVRYPGLPAPLPRRISTSNLDVLRYDLKGKYVLDGGMIRQVRFSANSTEIDKLNDNHTYGAGLPFPVEVRVNRKVTNVNLDLDGGHGAFKWTIGAGFTSDNRDAGRFARPGPVWMQNSPNFADATVETKSLKASGVWALDQNRRIKGAIQVDFVDADLGRMMTPVAGVTPAMMFNATYGPGSAVASSSETNLNASLRFEKDFASQKGRFFAGLSRTVRTANPRERYFVLTHPMAAASWVGNPNLAPEKHHMLEVGAGWKGGPWELAGRAYVDHVEDFILWDRIRPGNAFAGRNIFRNVDALITGVEATAKYKFGGGFWAGADIWLTRGQNTTDNRAIGQIPPAEAALRLGWANQKFSIETRLRLVAEQTRRDASPAFGSGVDSTTSGYGVLDISGTWKPKPNMAISFGIENVLDKAYTGHIERKDIAFPGYANPVAPGRSIWVKATMRF